MDKEQAKKMDEINHKLEMTRIKQSIIGYYEKTGKLPNKIYMTIGYYKKLAYSNGLNVCMVTSPEVKRIFDIPIEIVEDYKIK